MEFSNNYQRYCSEMYALTALEKHQYIFYDAKNVLRSLKMVQRTIYVNAFPQKKKKKG